MKLFKMLFAKKLQSVKSKKDEMPAIYGGDAKSVKTAAIINCTAMSTAHLLIDQFISEIHGPKESDWKRSVEYFVRDLNIPEFTVRAIGVITTSGEMRSYYFNISRPMNASKKLIKAVSEMTKYSVPRKHRILLIADEIAPSLKEVLEANGYDVNIVKSYGCFEAIYSELSRYDYDMLIPTNNSLSPEQILELVPVIKIKFPKIKIMVLSGWVALDFITDLKRLKIDDFASLLIDHNELIAKVNELLTANANMDINFLK
jgi:hypothetical protein